MDLKLLCYMLLYLTSFSLLLILLAPISMLSMQEDTDRADMLVTLMLGLIYLPTYIMAMLVTELTPAITTHPFLFVMLKYVLGTGHHSLVPLAIIAIRRDLRDLIKVSDCTVIHNSYIVWIGRLQEGWEYAEQGHGHDL